MIKAVNINKSYGALHVLRDVTLTIERGEVVSIVGASGAGKTTLLQILGTLDRADSGSINVWRCGRYTVERVRIGTLPKREDRVRFPGPPLAARIHRCRECDDTCSHPRRQAGRRSTAGV